MDIDIQYISRCMLLFFKLENHGAQVIDKLAYGINTLSYEGEFRKFRAATSSPEDYQRFAVPREVFDVDVQSSVDKSLIKTQKELTFVQLRISQQPISLRSHTIGKIHQDLGFYEH